VEYVLAQTQPAKHSFAGFSPLGSGILDAAAPLDTAVNRAVHDRLSNMPFTRTLDPNADDDAHTLLRCAFHRGNARGHNTISYQASIDTNLLTASLERSVLDPGTLDTAVTRMQQVGLEELATKKDPQLTRATELVWDDVAYDLTDYHAKA